MPQPTFRGTTRYKWELPSLLLELKNLFTRCCCSCLAVFLLCFSHCLQAAEVPADRATLQTQGSTATIRGTILDRETGQPVPFATLSVIAKNSHSQANSRGVFSLRVELASENEKVRVSSVGYVTQDFELTDLQKQQSGIRLYLSPRHESLTGVEVKARSRKWKKQKVGYHIDEGTYFHHEFQPADTVVTAPGGQEIGTRMLVKKRPAKLQSVSFGLAGSGGEKAVIGIRLYSLQNNLPHLPLLPAPVIITVPPHHTGWITVDMAHYNLTLNEDVALVLEWLTETNTLTTSTLMAFATVSPDQVTYYRETNRKPWQILKSTLINSRSFGMYVTLLYEK